MTTTELTILMPSYNKEEYIKEAMDSVLNQKTNFALKLVVTDDGSTDRTIEIVNSYAKRFPSKVILLPSERNQGLLSNIIKAYKYLMVNKSKYFCCLDADDFLTDVNFYQKAVDFLDANEEFNIYASNTSVMFDNGKIYVQDSHIKGTFRNSTFEDMLNDKAVLGNTISSVFRNCIIDEKLIKKLKKHIGNHYSEHSFREDDFRNRIHLENSKAHYVNEVVGTYRITQTGLYQGGNELKKILLKIQAYIDMYYFFDIKYPEFMKLALKNFRRIESEALNFDMNSIVRYPLEDILQLCKILDRLGSYDKGYIAQSISTFKLKEKSPSSLKAIFQSIFSIKKDRKKRS